MKIAFGFAVKVASVALLMAACGCRTSYEKSVAARSSVLRGDCTYALERAAEMADDSTDKNLGKLELGRLKHLTGDFKGSSAVFGPQLEDFFVDESEGPILKLDNIGGNILASTIRDDRAIPYSVPMYELLFALQYQALNSYYLGNRDNARVYLRRATAAQEQFKEKTEQETASSSDESSKYADNILTAQTRLSPYIDPVANNVRASYENALVWYLMGVIFGTEGASGNDRIAFNGAIDICPEIEKYTKPPSGSGEDVIVIFEESLVDIPEPIKIPLPFGGTLWSVDFPLFKASAFTPSRIYAESGSSKGGRNCIRAVNVQALAYRNMRDHLAGIVTRNITRAAVKIAAQQVANNVRTGNSYGDLALKFGVLAFNVFSTVTDEADTRSWQTLPECVQMCRLRLPPGERELKVRNLANGRSLNVTLPPGGKGPWLVWISDIHAFSTIGAIPLVSGPTTWRKDSSILGVKY